MFKRIIKIVGHLLFWALGIYTITRIYGIATVEIFANSENGKEEFIVTYDNNFTWAAIVTVGLSVIIFYTNILVFLKTYFEDKNFKTYFLKLLSLLLICVTISIIFNHEKIIIIYHKYCVIYFSNAHACACDCFYSHRTIG